MVWTRWKAWWTTPESTDGLALTRILIGLVVALSVAMPFVTGEWSLLWLPPEFGGYRTPVLPQWLAQSQVTPVFVKSLGMLALFSSLGVALGLGGPVGFRLICALSGISFRVLVGLNGHGAGSYDLLITNILWIVFLCAPIGSWSVHCWLTTGRWRSEAEIGRWGRILLVYQLLLMYTVTGWQKLSFHWVPWGDLSALYYILQQPSWQRGDMSWLASSFPLTQAATLGVWLWEVTAPVWLFATLRSADRPSTALTRVRMTYAMTGIGMHLLIGLFMNVGPFSWVSLAVYPCLVHPGEWRRLMRRRGPMDRREAGAVG